MSADFNAFRRGQGFETERTAESEKRSRAERCQVKLLEPEEERLGKRIEKKRERD